MLNRVLVATDGSDAALDASRLASRVVAPRGQVVLLHVVSGVGGTLLAAVDSVGLLIGDPAGGLGAEWMQRATQHGTELLALARRQLAYATTPTIGIATELEVGRPASTILHRLEHGAFDAVVIGGRGHGVIKHVLLGSVAAEVLLHATKPVLVGRRDTARRILVATDGSESSRRAAQAAGEIARATNAEVSIVSAVEIPMEVPETQRELIKGAVRGHIHSAMETARVEVGVALKEERLVFGDAIQSILNEAVSQDTDLIVVGRGREGTAGVERIGSVAYRTAMGAPCSVLVVP